jgi:hypothetical protein
MHPKIVTQLVRFPNALHAVWRLFKPFFEEPG